MTKNAFFYKNQPIRYEAFRDLSGRCIAEYNRSYLGLQMHFHRALEIICVLDGEVQLQTPEGTIKIVGGQSAVIEEMVLHTANGVSGGLYVTVLITEQYLDTFRRIRGNRKLASFICPDDPAGVIVSSIKALNQMNTPYKTDDETDSYRRALIDTMLLSVARQVGFTKKPAAADDSMLPVIAYVIDHLRENLTIREIAPRFGFTPRMLTKKFTEYTGIGLKEFITISKVSLAKQLLQQGMSLAQTAEQSGFGCMRTFHRIFFESENMTPGQYQAKLRQK